MPLPLWKSLTKTQLGCHSVATLREKSHWRCDFSKMEHIKKKIFCLICAIVLTSITAEMGRSSPDIVDQCSCSFDAGNLCNWSHDTTMSLLWSYSANVTTTKMTSPSKYSGML
ncbi:uncharacterized protein LOC116297510 [Actinia tenebrosa]|uniref:Uncharacterized protein LOC116297510 n=1 Tax=Actinia tenebrosa TaxID=6105 RepID=A0A6P8I245_ACTTE|nr:uncharacterized protein LOC116297510 [Actinia tenebrosa]